MQLRSHFFVAVVVEGGVGAYLACIMSLCVVVIVVVGDVEGIV